MQDSVEKEESGDAFSFNKKPWEEPRIKMLSWSETKSGFLPGSTEDGTYNTSTPVS
jgi:hypothetical protein